MGRRENAVAAETKQAKALALWLRAQRERCGLTYAAMAKLTGHQFTASALSRGASGRVPSLRLVIAFATACDADADEAVRLWKAARKAREERRRQAGISPEFRDLASSVRSVLRHPAVVDTFGKLHDVMVEMRARQGQPSLGELQTLAGRTPDGRHRLPKSSLSVVLRGEAVLARTPHGVHGMHGPSPGHRAALAAGLGPHLPSREAATGSHEVDVLGGCPGA